MSLELHKLVPKKTYSLCEKRSKVLLSLSVEVMQSSSNSRGPTKIKIYFLCSYKQPLNLKISTILDTKFGRVTDQRKETTASLSRAIRILKCYLDNQTAWKAQNIDRGIIYLVHVACLVFVCESLLLTTTGAKYLLSRTKI